MLLKSWIVMLHMISFLLTFYVYFCCNNKLFKVVWSWKLMLICTRKVQLLAMIASVVLTGFVLAILYVFFC